MHKCNHHAYRTPSHCFIKFWSLNVVDGFAAVTSTIVDTYDSMNDDECLAGTG